MADNKISDLPPIGTQTDSDLFETEQPGEAAGSRSRKETRAQFRAYLLDNDPTLAGDSANKAASQQAIKAFVEDSIDVAIAALDPNTSIGVQFVADTSSTTDADPGAGKIRWNHATQDSATVLFLDDATADGASLTAIWPRLNAGGVVFLQHATDQAIWQIWEFTAINDASGYAKLTVTKWGTNGTFANGDPILVTLDKGQDGNTFAGGSLTSALNEAKATNIASASTTDIGAATGNLVHVTGTTTITALGTVQAGTARTVVFDGALTLTHNATSLILPTGANILTAAGDVALFRSEGSGNWRCCGYLPASGKALVAATPAPVIVTTVSSNTITPTSATDLVRPPSLSAGLTIANPIGTGVDGFGMVFEFVDNGTARSLTWGSDFANYMATLPATTTLGKVHRIGVEYNAAAGKYRCMFAQVQP